MHTCRVLTCLMGPTLQSANAGLTFNHSEARSRLDERCLPDRIELSPCRHVATASGRANVTLRSSSSTVAVEVLASAVLDDTCTEHPAVIDGTDKLQTTAHSSEGVSCMLYSSLMGLHDFNSRRVIGIIPMALRATRLLYIWVHFGGFSLRCFHSPHAQAPAQAAS